MTAAELLAQARAERDAANTQREREWHRANEAERARDVALAERDQARAERDEQHARAEYLLLDRDLTEERRKLVREERDAAVKRAEAAEGQRDETCRDLRDVMAELAAAREENAQLKDAISLSGPARERLHLQTRLARAVAALRDIFELVCTRHTIGIMEIDRRIKEADAILTDPSATAAVEEMRELEAVYQAAKDVPEALTNIL